LDMGNAVSAFSVEHSGARDTPSITQLEEFKETHIHAC
jgi:sugar/nucleoside kinase (ribokinase family)